LLHLLDSCSHCPNQMCSRFEHSLKNCERNLCIASYHSYQCFHDNPHTQPNCDLGLMQPNQRPTTTKLKLFSFLLCECVSKTIRLYRRVFRLFYSRLHLSCRCNTMAQRCIPLAVQSVQCPLHQLHRCIPGTKQTVHQVNDSPCLCAR